MALHKFAVGPAFFPQIGLGLVVFDKHRLSGLRDRWQGLYDPLLIDERAVNGVGKTQGLALAYPNGAVCNLAKRAGRLALKA